jgi:spore maturation protein CgeB
MRIFYASDSAPNASIKSNLWDVNLYQPLAELGNEVIKFQYDLKKTFRNANHIDPIQKKFIKKNRPKVSRELLKQIKKEHNKKPIDLFFSYFYDACVLPEVITEIKSMGIKTINWYCNGSYQLDLVSEISPHYDYCLVPEKFRIPDYKKIGANPIYCQEAANPNIYKPYNFEQTYDVTFVGQAYGERPDYIKHILDNNINIHVFGIGWNRFAHSYHKPINIITRKIKKTFSPELFKFLTYKYTQFKSKKSNQTIQNSFEHISKIRLPDNIVGRVLSDKEMIQMYSRSKINIGFSCCGNTHKKNKILQVRLRDFEVPMSCGFYMVEYMKELEEFFDIGKEIVCYQNKKDLVDKIKYYLKHENERKKISNAGYQRCLKEHTWHKRFTSVFKQMQL